MKRSRILRSSIVQTSILLLVALRLDAAESKSLPLPARPYLSIFAASVDKILAAGETVFNSVDRPDLSSSLTERMKGFRDFSGIDRTKPLGIMYTWGELGQAEIVFLPVAEIDELLTTFTFNNTVGSHEVAPDQYEIERPDSPYHVLVRNDYAFFADSLPTIQALEITPDQLTRGMRDRYDVIVHLDLKQLPRLAKVKFVDGLRSQVEPFLQEQDREPVESAKLRKTVGKLFLEVIQRAVLDTNTVTIGGQLNPETRLLSFEIVLDAAKGSLLEAGLNRLASRRSEFTSLISPDVPAGVAINLPLGGLIEQILGSTGDTSAKGSRLELGLQIVGSGIGSLSVIAALRGDEISGLNSAIPRWIIKAEKTGYFVAVHESFDIHQKIVLHGLVPRELPTSISQFVGSDVEIIVGQGKQSVWFGIGPPQTLSDSLKDAIDLVDKTPATRGTGPLVRARFQAKQLSDVLASDLLIPAIDKEASRAAFDQGDDGFSLTIEPVMSGLKLRIEAEEGFVRLLWRNWSKQVDDLKR